jgi:putative sugar O-methyltransferase
MDNNRLVRILIEAAATGNAALLQSILDPGCFGCPIVETAMKVAAANGYAGIVSLLHQRGVDLAKIGSSALLLAQAANRTEVVRYLQSQGIVLAPPVAGDAAAASDQSTEPVAAALGQSDCVLDVSLQMPAASAGPREIVDFAFLGDLDGVERCLDTGAFDPRTREDAMIAAAGRGFFAIVVRLCKAGTSLYVRDGAVLRAAALGGHLEIVRFVMENEGLPPATGQGELLAGTLRSGRYTVFEYLTNVGLDSAEHYRATIESMRDEISQSDPIYSPSKIWDFLSEVHVRLLRQNGLQHFKRTLNQAYFNFVPVSISDRKLLCLVWNWLATPSLRSLRGTFLDPDINRETGKVLQMERRVFHQRSGYRRWLYRALLVGLWHYVDRHDRQRLARIVEPRLGDPILFMRKGRLLTQDLAHSILEVNRILDGFENDDFLNVAEIGGGYGRVAHVLMSARRCRYVMFDIPPALLVSQWYLSQLFPDRRIFKFRHIDSFASVREELEHADLAFFTINQIELFPPGFFDISINISSFHELRPEQIRHLMAQMFRITTRRCYLKQFWMYHNPYDGITVDSGIYISALPTDWVTSHFEKDPVDSGFFELLVDRSTLPSVASLPPPSRPVPEMRAATVAILLATYNHAHFLPTALAGFEAQTRRADEIIIVDDGSTDNTATLLSSFAARLPNTRVIRHPKNLGLQQAIRTALGVTQADYFVWAAADDVLLPDFLDKSMRRLAEYPQAGLCFSNLAVFTDGSGQPRSFDGGPDSGPAFDYRDLPAFISPEEMYRVLEARYIWISSNTVVVRRDYLMQTGAFEPGLHLYADWFAFLTVALRYGSCGIPETLAYMREVPSSYSREGRANRKKHDDAMAGILRTIKSPRHRDIIDFFRHRPTLLSLFGPRMLWIAISRGHFDLVPGLVKYYGRGAKRQILRRLATLRHRCRIGMVNR